MKHLISVIIATFAFVLSAPTFTNVFIDYYKSSGVDIGNVIQSKAKPQVYSSQDINADRQRRYQHQLRMPPQMRRQTPTKRRSR